MKENDVTDLLSPHELAAAVSGVTARICGLSFLPGAPFARGEAAGGRLFIFPVHGRRRFGLLLSCDRPASVALARRLAGVGADLTSGELVEASIRDLLARVAVGLEVALDGGRRQRPDVQRTAPVQEGTLGEGIPLCSDEVPGVRLWIVHRASPMSTPAFVSDVARDFQ
jgi:hypothetical protein